MPPALSVFNNSKLHFALRSIFFIAYSLGIACTIYHHVPWKDEAAVWVTAHDMSLADALNYFRYDGHPPLWWLVLTPFARLGFPPGMLQVLAAAIAAASVWLILFRCPLWWPLRLAFLFTVGGGYQYSVVARGYGLMILLLFAIATLHPRRMEQPLRYALFLALLWQTEAHAFGAAGILCLLFAYDLWKQGGTWQRLLPLALPAISALLMLLLLWPPPAENTHVLPFHATWLNSLAVLSASFLPANTPYVYGAALVPLLAWAAWLLRSPRGAAIYAATLGWLLFMCMYVFCGTHHLFLFTPLWMFAMWTAAADRPAIYAQNKKLRWDIEFPIALLFALQAPTTFHMHSYDYTHAFSGGRDMANYIRERGLDSEPIALSGCFDLMSVIYYFPHTDFWFAAEDRRSHYLMVDKQFDACYAMPPAAVMQRIIARSPQGTLILADKKDLAAVPLKPPYRLELLHKSPGFSETFELYRLTQGKLR